MTITDHQRIEWSRALRANLEQLTALHGIVQERIDRLKATEEALETASRRVAEERVQEGEALSALSSASEDAVRRARLVGVKLEARFLEGELGEELYKSALAAVFPRGAQSIGTTPAQRFDALERIVAGLAQHPDADPSGALGKLARDGADAIKKANDDAKREQLESREAADQLARAQHQFDEAYLATKEILSGILREAGRLPELLDIFPDL
jgi:hypothetical protein